MLRLLSQKDMRRIDTYWFKTMIQRYVTSNMQLRFCYVVLSK